MSEHGQLFRRIGRVTTLFAEAAKVKATLETIRRQVASHRAQGLKLVETGGNPDPLWRRPKQPRRKSWPRSAGDPEAGALKLNAAQASLQEAQATIEAVQKARSFCERDNTARVRETERLRTAISQAESYQADLERDFAASSWNGVARNLEQAHALLATFDRQVQDAVAAASSNNQQYLKAPAFSRSAAPAANRPSADVRAGRAAQLVDRRPRRVAKTHRPPGRAGPPG